MDIVAVLPTALIVVCEVIALVLIISRGGGAARTLGVIGMVILIIGSIAGAIWMMSLPMVYDRLGGASASIVAELRNIASVGFAFLGLALVGAAVIVGSRRSS